MACEVEMSGSARHLIWIPAVAFVGFAVPFVFADLSVLPLDFYYLVYFAAIGALASYYAVRTQLDVRVFVRRRLIRGIVLGIVVGLILAQGVLAQPETPRLSGMTLWWTLFWRGLVYGLIDGLLLFSLPWVITWRAFDAERHGIGRMIATAFVAWIAVLVVTTAYHLGYRDFRSSKIVQPNIGNTIGSIATLAAANPIASPIAHVFLHVTAVVHSPRTDLFLPPHRP
jgi:hypothetical protein